MKGRKDGVRVARACLNTGRTLVASDIHGNLPLLKEVLRKAEYRPGADSLVIVGDTLEKGPENLNTLQFIMELARERNVWILCGNCDVLSADDSDWFFEYLMLRRGTSLYWEMAEKAGISLPEGPEGLPGFLGQLRAAFPREFQFIDRMPHVLETGRFLFAHAGLQDENLERQDPEYVLSRPRFPEAAGHCFSKLLVVGHYPTVNYRTNWLDNAPFYEKRCNCLSIDGGNIIKSLGQLNAVILENDKGTWSWVSADCFPEAAAPCSQQARAGIAIVWPENSVEVLKRGGVFSLCRHLKTGAVLEIPNDFLHEEAGKVWSDDVTDSRLAVEKGELLGIVRREADRWLIRKGSAFGWLFLQ